MRVTREIAELDRLAVLKRVAVHVYCKAACNRDFEQCNQREGCRNRIVAEEIVSPGGLPDNIRREVSLLVNGFHEGN
jgi:hypothetical protein